MCWTEKNQVHKSTNVKLTVKNKIATQKMENEVL